MVMSLLSLQYETAVSGQVLRRSVLFGQVVVL